MHQTKRRVLFTIGIVVIDRFYHFTKLWCAGFNLRLYVVWIINAWSWGLIHWHWDYHQLNYNRRTIEVVLNPENIVSIISRHFVAIFITTGTAHRHFILECRHLNWPHVAACKQGPNWIATATVWILFYDIDYIVESVFILSRLC